MKQSIKWLCLSVLSIQTFISHGQANTADTIPENLQLNEVVISVNNAAEKKDKVTQQVEIIDSKTIDRIQAQNTADLLAQTGAVTVQKSQQGGGSPIIRGFEASRILLVVDGVRMNNLIYRSGHLQNILTVDNLALERAEVLFGPSSTVYGSDALGGVIHLITKKPVFSSSDIQQTSVQLQTRLSSANNESTTGVDINLGWNRWAARTILSYSNFGDLRSGAKANPFFDGKYIERDYYITSKYGPDSIVRNDNPRVQLGSGYRQYNILQKVSFLQNDYTRHHLNIQYSNSSDVPRYDRLTDTDSEGKLKFSAWYYGPQERLMTAYELHRNRPSAFFSEARLNVNYQFIEESRHQRRYQNPELQHRIEYVNIIGFNYMVMHKGDRHEFQCGTDGQYNTLRSVAYAENIYTGDTTSLDTRYPNDGSSMSNVGVYASHIYKINQRWNLTDGIRVGYSDLQARLYPTDFFQFPFDEIRQRNPFYSASVGMAFHPDRKLKLSGMISTGFRVPNIDDLAKIFDSSGGLLIVPNPAIKPEKTVNGEIGLHKILGNKIRIEFNTYVTLFTNALQVAPFLYEGQDSIEYDGSMSKVVAAQNLGNALIHGLSASMRYQVTDLLQLQLNGNYTKGRIHQNDITKPLDHIAPISIRCALLYQQRHFFAEAFSLFNGQKKLEDYSDSGEDNLVYATPVGMPAWYTLNMRAGYEINTAWMIQVGVDNILDTSYRVFASGINASGRNVYITAKLKF